MASQSGYDALEKVLIQGDLSKLSPQERVTYYLAVCKAVGVDPRTRPFEYVYLQGKLVLYARKDCTDQLRRLRGISVQVVSQTIDKENGVCIVTATARTPDGREDSDIGVVPITAAQGKLTPEAYANALMKAFTKAKRRVTLSICGLGLLEESELDTIPDAKPLPPEEAPALPEGEVEDKAEQPAGTAQAPSEAHEETPDLDMETPVEEMSLEECNKFIAKFRDMTFEGSAPQRLAKLYAWVREKLGPDVSPGAPDLGLRRRIVAAAREELKNAA